MTPGGGGGGGGGGGPYGWNAFQERLAQSAEESIVEDEARVTEPVKRDNIPITAETLREMTGFKLAIIFPTWQTDAAGVVGFHDELERLGKALGWQNVIGSVYQDMETRDLNLGVFVKESVISVQQPE